MKKGLLLGAIHVAMVLSVTAQFAYDRATLPRVWVRALPVDPNLPIRGRYVRLNLEVDGDCGPQGQSSGPVDLYAGDGRLKGRPAAAKGHYITRQRDRCVLDESVAYFIPASIPDPSRREPGEELWVEVSVPRDGPPRPIQLAVRKDGEHRPLNIN